MLKERLKRILTGAQPDTARTGGFSTAVPQPPGSAGQAAPREAFPEQVYSRHSHGLDQFFSHIESESGLALLDLGGITQSNVTFITSLGHRLYSEDFLRSHSGAFDDGAQPDQDEIGRFLNQSLDFGAECFDGVLVWDVLEYLPAPLLRETVEHLFRIVKPGCHLLAFFHTEEKPVEVPAYSYRIADSKTLLLARQGGRRPAQVFNNRSIEKLFERFQSVKFFLARDHLREVIVTR